MKDTFRTPAFWKSSILSMSDNSFFELMRSVFGKIKTPFSKQQLISDLESFLSGDNIKKTIASYIDENDARVIAAIALIGEPTPEQLAAFFFGEFSIAQLQDIVVNMEERFILYRFIEEKKPELYHYGSGRLMRNNQADNKNNSGCLALNPILKNILLPYTKDISFLFPMIPADDNTPSGQSVYSDLIFASLYSFAANRDLFFRSENSNKLYVIRRRIIEDAKTYLPEVDLDNLIGSSLVMGLFYIEDEKLIPDKKRIDDFGLLSSNERREYFAAALITFLEINPGEILPPLFRSKIREYVSLIHGFITKAADLQSSANENDLIFPKRTLIKMIEILKAQTEINITTDNFLKNLEKAGLIIQTQTGYILKSNSISASKKKNEKQVITLDSDSSILAYPEIDFNDAVLIASFSDISGMGTSSISPVMRFEIRRDSVVRAYNNNISADKIIDLLSRLSGKKINETLIWNLKDWEKRHNEVTIRKGVILNLSEEHRYLTETKPFTALIKETLAPGLYLLNDDEADEAEYALRDAGIDIIGQRKREMSEDTKNSANNFTKPAASDLHFSKINFQSAVKPEKKSSGAKKSKQSTEDNVKNSQKENADALTESFHVILDKMPLNETEKAELSARIDRRLILSETQLKEANLRYEKLEARHMDYAGKQNIAKQAIAQQSPLEIVRLNKNTSGKHVTIEEEKIYGIPKTLEKDGTQHILVLDTDGAANTKTSTQNGELLRIPLAKISLLRRIKKSIFEI